MTPNLIKVPYRSKITTEGLLLPFTALTFVWFPPVNLPILQAHLFKHVCPSAADCVKPHRRARDLIKDDCNQPRQWELLDITQSPLTRGLPLKILVQLFKKYSGSCVMRIISLGKDRLKSAPKLGLLDALNLAPQHKAACCSR
tara:strand:+ start:41 stop:469 length:429 start_codon:yes stop_codon:yes gene_type:complete